MTRRRERNLSGQFRKALSALVTGTAIWVATYVSAKWGALDVVVAGAIQVWLVPNDPPPEPYSPPTREAGQSVLWVVLLLLAIAAMAVWLSQHVTITTH